MTDRAGGEQKRPGATAAQRKAVGSRIRALRKASGKTIAAVAAATNRTDSAVKMWERGARTPPESVIVALSGVFQVPPSELRWSSYEEDGRPKAWLSPNMPDNLHSRPYAPTPQHSAPARRPPHAGGRRRRQAPLLSKPPFAADAADGVAGVTAGETGQLLRMLQEAIAVSRIQAEANRSQAAANERTAAAAEKAADAADRLARIAEANASPRQTGAEAGGSDVTEGDDHTGTEGGDKPSDG